MNRIRRALVAALAIGLVRPLAALAAWNKEAFGAKSAADALTRSSDPRAGRFFEDLLVAGSIGPVPSATPH